MIKIIHQIWLQGEDRLPDKYKPFVKKWKEIYNDCKYILWSDEMVRKEIKKFLPYLYSLYDLYPYWIQRVDVAKYVILYLYGGLYVDMDIEPFKYFNFFFYDIVLAKSETKYRKIGEPLLFYYYPKFGNDLIYVNRSFHPFINFILAKLKRSLNTGIIFKHIIHTIYISITTGPFFVSKYFNEFITYRNYNYFIISIESFKEYIKDYREGTWVLNKNKLI